MNSIWVVTIFLLSLLVLPPFVICDCPNGCSSRGLCINNNCVCAEGLSGSDCSISTVSTYPTLYQCPSCYTVTVGPARYYTGPSWRIPDGPIVGLNYKGSLSVYQGNGNGELVSQGTDVDDFIPAPIVALQGGAAGEFDSCGSWIMRAFTAPNGKVLGFYHAETECDYANNGQTRKSGAYSESVNGGLTFTKPNYPNNRVIDTSTPILIGMPSGEGDFSVLIRGDFYYLFFANVETYHTGVARAPIASGGTPGSFKKYYNGQWNSTSVGGNSSKLANMVGPQAYLHTPTKSFVTVGNFNPYWNEGFMMSVSDDALNWTFFSDPVFTPDPITNTDQVMYPSFLGSTGGFDIGSRFKFFYMWIPPGSSWTYRYQVYKDVTLTYTGANNTSPLAKVALATYRHSDTGETWQTTEVTLAPYAATNIVGYLMSRPYSHSFVVYDCYNYTSSDHFVGTAEECFLSGGEVEATRTLGYIWATRVVPSIAVHRCYGPKDIFLSTDPNCEGRAPAVSFPFGYMLSGPGLSASTSNILIAQGSQWLYFNKSAPASTWIQRSFDDSTWLLGQAPFGTGYSQDLQKTPFGTRDYYFRSNFTIPSGRTVKKNAALCCFR